MYPIKCLLVCLFIASLIGTLEAVERSNALSRNSTPKQSKSVYNGLHVANGRSHELTPTNILTATSKGRYVPDKASSFKSAWAIITLIVVVVAGGATGYYVTLFYPLICKKQGKYDIMEHSPV